MEEKLFAKNLLAKQIVNEVEGDYLALVSTYDLDAIEQLELLDRIVGELSYRFEGIKKEYCYSCGKYYKKDDCFTEEKLIGHEKR